MRAATRLLSTMDTAPLARTVAKAFQRRLLSTITTDTGFRFVLFTLVLSLTAIVLGTVSLSASVSDAMSTRSACAATVDNIGDRSFARELCSEPIDVVYTWVNGSDPAWLAEMARYRALEGGVNVSALAAAPHSNGTTTSASANRYRDNDELRFSMRSLAKYAPWVRRIVLVTNGQVPAWLDVSHPRISVVTHAQIFPDASHLPVFSSPAIEVHLHRIPGLSSRFVYFNDDVLLGSDVWPDDFFTRAGGQKVYLSWEVPKCAPGCVDTWLGDGFCDTACNTTRCGWDAGDCIGNATKSRSSSSGSSYRGGRHSTGTTAGAVAAGGPGGDGQCAPGCPDSWLGDRMCDQKCTQLACGWDGGDCGMDRVTADFPGAAPELPPPPMAGNATAASDGYPSTAAGGLLASALHARIVAAATAGGGLTPPSSSRGRAHAPAPLATAHSMRALCEAELAAAALGGPANITRSALWAAALSAASSSPLNLAAVTSLLLTSSHSDPEPPHALYLNLSAAFAQAADATAHELGGVHEALVSLAGEASPAQPAAASTVALAVCGGSTLAGACDGWEEVALPPPPAFVSDDNATSVTASSNHSSSTSITTVFSPRLISTRCKGALSAALASAIGNSGGAPGNTIDTRQPVKAGENASVAFGRENATTSAPFGQVVSIAGADFVPPPLAPLLLRAGVLSSHYSMLVLVTRAWEAADARGTHEVAVKQPLCAPVVLRNASGNVTAAGNGTAGRLGIDEEEEAPDGILLPPPVCTSTAVRGANLTRCCCAPPAGVAQPQTGATRGPAAGAGDQWCTELIEPQGLATANATAAAAAVALAPRGWGILEVLVRLKIKATVPYSAHLLSAQAGVANSSLTGGNSAPSSSFETELEREVRVNVSLAAHPLRVERYEPVPIRVALTAGEWEAVRLAAGAAATARLVPNATNDNTTSAVNTSDLARNGTGATTNGTGLVATNGTGGATNGTASPSGSSDAGASSRGPRRLSQSVGISAPQPSDRVAIRVVTGPAEANGPRRLASGAVEGADDIDECDDTEATDSSDGGDITPSQLLQRVGNDMREALRERRRRLLQEANRGGNHGRRLDATGDSHADAPVRRLVSRAWRRVVTAASAAGDEAAVVFDWETLRGLHDAAWARQMQQRAPVAGDAAEATRSALRHGSTGGSDGGADPDPAVANPRARGRRLSEGSEDTYGDSLVRTQRLISARFGKRGRKVPAHMPHMIDVRVMTALQEAWPAEFAATSSHRFRSSLDLQYAFAYFAFLMEGGARVGIDLSTYWGRELDTDGDGELNDNEFRTFAAVVYKKAPSQSEIESLRNCTSPQGVVSVVQEEEARDGAGDVVTTTVTTVTRPRVTLERVMGCASAMEGLSKHARFPPTHEEAREEEVAFEMVTDNFNKTRAQLDSVRSRKAKFVCVNDDMREAPEATRDLLRDFYLAMFPHPSAFELPPGREHAEPLYIGPINARLAAGRSLGLTRAVVVAAALAAACAAVVGAGAGRRAYASAKARLTASRSQPPTWQQVSVATTALCTKALWRTLVSLVATAHAAVSAAVLAVAARVEAGGGLHAGTGTGTGAGTASGAAGKKRRRGRKVGGVTSPQPEQARLGSGQGIAIDESPRSDDEADNENDL